MKIIDSHIHLWDLSLKKHAWLLEKPGDSFLGDYSPLQTSYLPANYQNDAKAHQVEKTVHIQAGWSRDDLLGEVQWLTELNQTLGSPDAIIAYANLTSTQLETELNALSQFPLVKSIRQIIAWHANPYYRSCDADYLNDAKWQQGFAKLAQHGLCFDLQIFPEQASAAYQLGKLNPQVPIVIEHALQPIQHDSEYLAYWRRQLAKLAELPNFYLKLSGLHLFNHQPDHLVIKNILEICVEIFTPSRCMFGSNFPIEKLFVSYDELMNFYLAFADQYLAYEREQLFYQTAKQFYRL